MCERERERERESTHLCLPVSVMLCVHRGRLLGVLGQPAGQAPWA